MSKTKSINKSAATGRIVSDRYAKSHPSTTYTTRVPVVRPGKGK